jgi:hypothetical protein
MLSAVKIVQKKPHFGQKLISIHFCLSRLHIASIWSPSKVMEGISRKNGNRCPDSQCSTCMMQHEFGLLRLVRQPSADTYMILVARHKVTRPQTILKFRPTSSLDYRTRDGSQSILCNRLMRVTSIFFAVMSKVAVT